MSMLKQARDAILRNINLSPTKIEIKRKPLIDDGFGGKINNPFGIDITIRGKVRLAHEKRYPSPLSPSPSGFSTDVGRFILADYKTFIHADDCFDALGTRWKIGLVDPIVNFGGIIGYQAPLTEAKNENST